MNPKGKWIFHNLQFEFVNEDIDAIYGRIYPQVHKFYGKRWYWEARINIAFRINTNVPIDGYAPTQEKAQEIVETLLRCTDTVEF
jgi:hypothetical protein